MKIKSIMSVLAVMLMLTGMAGANLSSGTAVGASCDLPTIGINGGDVPNHERFSLYTDAGAVFGNANAENTNVANYVNSQTPGIYNVTYTATNKCGTTTAIRNVTVVDTVAPANVVKETIVIGNVTANSIELSWTNPTDIDFADIVITVTPAGGSPLPGLNKLTIPGDKANTYNITGLLPGTSYTILLQSADDQEPNHPGDGS